MPPPRPLWSRRTKPGDGPRLTHLGVESPRGRAIELEARFPAGPLVRAAADFLFPPVCLACETGRCRAGEGGVCRTCWAGLRPLPQPRCGVCETPLPRTAVTEAASERCGRCRLVPPAFESLMTACLYEGTARSIVRAFKYAGADYLAEKLGSRVPIPGADDAPSAVIPVPGTRRERREKGFEPAALLAGVVARRVGAPLVDDVLLKARETRRQARLSLPERRRNVAGAFRARPAPRDVLLVDDVVTSGATLSACSRALVRAGARRVRAAAFARALPEIP